MSKKILVLGAGLVSKPLVDYLLAKGFYLTVATRTVSKAENLIKGHPKAKAVKLNVEDDNLLSNQVKEADLVISLLPYTYHVKVAEFCLEHGKHMVTTSYVSDAMKALNNKAKEKGILILNEIGLDPGIDHMSAMKIIHDIQKNKGRINSFYSYCGGLPAPDANNKPFGYKFSWSPRGVVLAGRNSAKYLKEGKAIEIDGADLFDNFWNVKVDGLNDFEAYPNRNSLPYIKLYGLDGISTMLRGTFRNTGWCATWKKIADIGYLDDDKKHDFSNKTFKQFLLNLMDNSPRVKNYDRHSRSVVLKSCHSRDEVDRESSEHISSFPRKRESSCLKNTLANYLNIDPKSEIISRLEWLGLLEDKMIEIQNGSALDLLVDVLLKKLQYDKGERDMIVLQHEFEVEYPNKKEKIISTLIDYGIPNGDSAMSRTVALPAAIATRMILENKINLKGVHIPVLEQIYEPVLKELENMGIKFKERKIGD